MRTIYVNVKYIECTPLGLNVGGPSTVALAGAQRFGVIGQMSRNAWHATQHNSSRTKNNRYPQLSSTTHVHYLLSMSYGEYQRAKTLTTQYQRPI